MRRPRIGVLSVYFGLFDEQMPPGFRADREQAAQRLAALLEPVGDVHYPGLISSDEDGRAAGRALADGGVDCIVFAPSMAAPPSYALAALEEVRRPLVIWNAPGVARLDADLTQAGATVETTQVAAVMLANPLVREGRRFVTVTARPGDEDAIRRLRRIVAGAAAAGALDGATALRVGDPIPGYADVEASADELARLGVRELAVDVATLEQRFDAAGPAGRESALQEARAHGWAFPPEDAESGPECLERSARLASALGGLVADAGASCVTVNCHGPHLRGNERIGIPACLAASLLTARGVPVSCTGDQPTALTMLLARRLAGASLYCELYTPEAASGLMLVAAGGEGDPAWADADGVTIEPNRHYPGRRGHGLGVRFRLRPGPATLLSLSPAGDGWRLAWATGEVVETRYTRMGGPNAMFRFDSGGAERAGEDWIASGATHHAALAPGRLDVEIEACCTASGLRGMRV